MFVCLFVYLLFVLFYSFFFVHSFFLVLYTFCHFFRIFLTTEVTNEISLSSPDLGFFMVDISDPTFLNSKIKVAFFFFKSINFQLFNFFSTVIISTAVIVKNCFLIKHLSQFEWYWIGSSCTCRVDVAGRLPSINFNENSHIETQWQNSKF